jgi:hypothetical protein
MSTIFPGNLNQCLPPTVSVETGGSLTTNGTIYLGIQAFNESGVNFCSTLVLANYTVGSRIRVQFNSANRTKGTLFPYYLLIASPNNDKANGHVIGIWKNWEDNGKTLATFSDLLLSQNTDLTITPSSVANPLALPTNAIQGQIRTVTSLGAYYMRLNTPQAVDGVKVISDSLGNKWVLNLGSTILANNPFFPRPIYTPDGSGSLFDPDQSPIRLAFLNLYESEMGVGRRLRLNCFLNGSEPVSNLLSGKIFARVLGFVNIESGELVTENDTGDGNDMDGIGEWVSVDTKLGFFVFQRPLPYNWVVAVEIAVGFKSSELQIAPGSVLSFTLSCGVQSGVLVEGGLIYRQPQGGLIYKDENYTGRVLPDSVGVKVGRMRGGMIHGSQSRIFEFLDTPEQFLSGFLTNTVGQKITLSRDGVATFRGIDAIQSSEALLAIVSTKAGESRVFWGASESVLSSQGISALITYPSGGFNVSLIRFYLLINGVLYRQDSPSGITTGLTSQTFNISAITGFSLIALEPTNYIPGLFLSPGIAVSLSSGSLSGNIKLGVSYVYSGSVLSAISQDVSLGCLPILDFDAMIERTARKMALIFG